MYLIFYPLENSPSSDAGVYLHAGIKTQKIIETTRKVHKELKQWFKT
jgi:hypothetical protein